MVEESGPRRCVHRFDLRARGGWGRHEHEAHQLAWAADGLMTVEVGDRHWVLAPTQAIWIPSGVVHDVAVVRPSVLHSAYIAPDACRLRFEEPTVLRVTALLAGLLLHLGECPQDGPEDPATARAWDVLFDALSVLPVTGLQLVPPLDPRARVIAETLLRRPDDRRTLEDWSVELGASSKTLHRVFVADTGMSFGQWRTQARLHASLPLLAAGRTVSDVASRVGYRSVNGYVNAFRAQFGHSPAAHYRAVA